MENYTNMLDSNFWQWRGRWFSSCGRLRCVDMAWPPRGPNFQKQT